MAPGTDRGPSPVRSRETAGDADPGPRKPRNRANRRCRQAAYQACRARSFVRLARVASMIGVSPALCLVTSPIDTITHHIERPRALTNRRIPLDPAVVPCRVRAQDGGSSMRAGDGTTGLASRIADRGS